MKAELIKIKTMKSKLTNGNAYILIFKCEDGKSRRAWVDSSYRNWDRWKNLLELGIVLDNLIVKANIIDADSFPRIVARNSQAIKKVEPKHTDEEAEQLFEQHKLIDIEQLPKERKWY